MFWIVYSISDRYSLIFLVASRYFLSEDEKAQRAAIAIEMNKTIQWEREAVLGHVSSLPQESQLGPREPRLYVNEDGDFP